MNNTIIEVKNTLEGINSRITEAEEQINDREDRMLEITAMEHKKEKRMKRNEDSLRDLWDNIKCTNIRREPFLYHRFLLVIYFIHITVYLSIPVSQFIPQPSPPDTFFPPLVSICLFSTSVFLFLPCKPIHLYHFSKFHIYALIYDICFSLCDLLHSV